MAQEPIEITGVWTRRIGDHVETLVEINGAWVKVIEEHIEGSFSHIVEPLGMEKKAKEHGNN